MSIFEAIILGLIQGLTEFIPISSSGHLILAQHLLGHESDHLFLEYINIGTVLALIIFFWPRLKQMARALLIENDILLIRNIVIAVLPAGVFGFLLADFIRSHSFFASPWVVAATLFIVGLLLVTLEKLPRLTPIKDSSHLSSKRTLGIGMAQALALVPGVSRSGSTIIAGRLSGMSAAAAAEFSFLLSIPIMLGVITKLLVREADRTYLIANIQPIIISNSAALLSGLLAVGFLMRYLTKHNLAIFGWYRIGLAVAVVMVLLLQ